LRTAREKFNCRQSAGKYLKVPLNDYTPDKQF
jgi:hypothetical protein